MNLHRNVIFRDNGDRARQVEPFTTMRPQGSDNPVDLWKWMDAYEKKTGGNVLAIVTCPIFVGPFIPGRWLRLAGG